MMYTNGILFLASVLIACGVAAASSTPQTATSASDEQVRMLHTDAAARLLAISDRFILRYAEWSPGLSMLLGERVTRMPQNSAEAAASLARSARALQQDMASIDPKDLLHDERLTFAMLEEQLELAVEGEQHFLHRFNVTPYAVGLVFNSVVPWVLGNATFGSDEDIDAYLAFLRDVARYLEDDLVRLEAQAARGIRLPKAAIPGARTALEGIPGVGSHIAS